MNKIKNVFVLPAPEKIFKYLLIICTYYVQKLLVNVQKELISIFQVVRTRIEMDRMKSWQRAFVSKKSGERKAEGLKLIREP